MDVLFNEVVMFGDLAVHDSLLLVLMLVEEAVIGLKKAVELLLQATLGKESQTHAFWLCHNKIINFYCPLGL